MKTLILSLCAIFLFLNLSHAVLIESGDSVVILDDGTILEGKPYKWKNFFKDVQKDTENSFFRDIRAGWYFDLLDKPNKRDKLGISSQIIAWRKLSLNPTLIYTPTGVKAIAEFGVTLNLYLLGDRNTGEEKEYLRKSKGKRITDRIYLGSYLGPNFSTGQFMLGVEAGLIF